MGSELRPLDDDDPQEQQQQHQHPLVPPPLPQRCHAIVSCPRTLVGRIIGKRGTTVKGIQRFSGASITIDQVLEPATLVILGSAESVHMATRIVHDIIAGTFKGFALLRQVAVVGQTGAEVAPAETRQFVYAPGFGMFPQRQLFAVAATTPWGSSSSSSSWSTVDVRQNHAIQHMTTAVPTPATATMEQSLQVYRQLHQQQQQEAALLGLCRPCF